MTLQNKIRDQLEASMSFYVHDKVWLTIPPLPFTEKLYLIVLNSVSNSVKKQSIELVATQELQQYDFNK